MKSRHNVYTLLTTFLVILLPYSCKYSNKTTESKSLKAYQIAQSAQDYPAATGFLIKMAAEDSASQPWVYDSLAFYHYFYLITPGVVRNTHTARFYAQRGLEINPENHFLAEIKAKLDLEDQKVEIAQSSFQTLWNKTKDYTYLWILTYMDAASKGGMKTADSVITAVLGNPEAEKKTVRLDFPQERVRETVPAKSAFMYLRASFLLEQNKVMDAASLLNEVLKMTPEFYGAKRLVYMIQQQGGQKQ